MKILSIIKTIWGSSQEWEPHELWPWQTVIGIDGSPLAGSVMRRTVGGKHQYRAMGEEEAAEDRESHVGFSGS